MHFTDEKTEAQRIELDFLRVQSLLAIEPSIEMRPSNSSDFPLTVMRGLKTLHCQQPTFIVFTYTQGTHCSGCIIIICYNFTPIKKPIESLHVDRQKDNLSK